MTTRLVLYVPIVSNAIVSLIHHQSDDHFSVEAVNQVLVCSDGDVRLRGTTKATEGIVEICINGEWGSVCDNGWSFRDAAVVCRQLGYHAQGEFGLFQYTVSRLYYRRFSTI